MDKQELFFCCRTGNLSRIRYLVEEKDIDLNARDKWDGTPLYYACLCGHYDVVVYLLENGVQCDADTFDGERCLYGALTNDIRHLLRNFKVISAITMRRDKYSEFLRRAFEVSDYSDIQFILENEDILAHKAILTCRSKYFKHHLNATWNDKAFIDFSDQNIPSNTFRNLMQYLYMGHININKKDLKSFITLAEHFTMIDLVNEIKRILSSISKKKMSVLFVQLCPLPQQDFLKLYLSSLPKELLPQDTVQEICSSVDLHIKIDDYVFYCHKVFICGRCSYLKALVTDHFSEASICDDGEIQVITLHETNVQVFVKILQYIYTDTADLSPENTLDVLCLADLFMLPGLKILCASVMQEYLTIDNVIPVIKLVRMYSLPRLEDQCIEFMAEHLEKIIHRADFKNLIRDDANDIKDRQEVDTISVIDDIRYYIDRSSNSSQKHLLITHLLENLKLEA